MANGTLMVHVVRHGEAHYEQRETTVDQAKDLTQRGHAQVYETAKMISGLHRTDEEFTVYSSPFGRCLHTAKIIANQLAVAKLHSGEEAIQVDPLLGELRGFSWEHFSAVVNGGPIPSENGEEPYVVKKSQTNPDRVDEDTYFAQDLHHQLPEEVTAEWPERLRKWIDDMETYDSAAARMGEALHRVFEEHLENRRVRRVILVTHHALACALAHTRNPGDFRFDPGDAIGLFERNGALFLKRTGVPEPILIRSGLA